MPNRYETLPIVDATVACRNFSGVEKPMNQKGYRNFLLIINPATAEDLAQRNWPVITLQPKKEGDSVGYALKVNIKFNYNDDGSLKSPMIWRSTKSGRVMLTEKTVYKLDAGIIEKVDTKVTYIHKDYNPRTGKPSDKIWLDKLVAFVEEDEFDSRYYDLMNDTPGDELPFDED